MEGDKPFIARNERAINGFLDDHPEFTDLRDAMRRGDVKEIMFNLRLGPDGLCCAGCGGSVSLPNLGHYNLEPTVLCYGCQGAGPRCDGDGRGGLSFLDWRRCPNRAGSLRVPGYDERFCDGCAAKVAAKHGIACSAV